MFSSPFESPPMALPSGVALLVLLLATAVPAVGVAQTAKLKGKVIDSELGEPIPAAVVKIKGSGSPVTADSGGAFSFEELKPGEIDEALARSWQPVALGSRILRVETAAVAMAAAVALQLERPGA